MSRQQGSVFSVRNSRRWWLSLSMAAISVIGSIPLASGVAASINIVQEGKSAFVIVVPKVAAQSVNEAAAEMQADIAESTGAKLPIVKDDDSISGPLISLGSTKQAQTAGISAQGIADDGFRIVTKEGNLYIIGLDTSAIDLNQQGDTLGRTFNLEKHPEIPGPEVTKDGGTSQGTANGVYSFLEDALDVRWLMPGNIGRDIPQKSTFTIEDSDRTVTPMFVYRAIPYTGRDEFGRNWRNRMKLGASFRLHHNHAWADIVPATLYKEHPDWFAMNSNGKRPAPNGPNYKLETTNPELVKFVAEKAIEALKAQPELNTFSLSPTDGLGYSESPESRAFYDQGQITKYGGAPSITPLILKFYSDVSAIVAKEYPPGKLAGGFYQQYRFPPSDGKAKIPDNFVPVLVGAASSYRGYRQEMRGEESSIINGWGKIFPSIWFYDGHPTWLRESTALVSPAMPEFTNILFEDLVKNQCQGVFYYGDYSWSQGALKNYIGAKKLWDPKADAVAIQHEWLTRAYGPKAGAVMEEFYKKMDESWFADYFRQPGTSGGQISEAFFKQIYGAHYPQMEELILKAEAQPMTEPQKVRLRLISDNMRVLQWRMRNAGYLPANYSSRYTIDAAQVFKMISDYDNSKGFFTFGTRGVHRYSSDVKPVKVQIGQSKPEKTGDIPNSNLILLYPTRNGVVHVKPTNVHPGSSFLYYFVHDSKGEVLLRGLLDNNTDVTFTAEADKPYYFIILHGGVRSNPQINWEISIPGATLAQASFVNGVVSLNAPPEKKAEPLYVYIPEGLNLTTQQSEAGVVIQTLTTAEQKSRDQRAVSQEAEAAVAMALKQYQGTLIQNLDAGWKFSPDPEKTGVQQGFAKSDFADKSWKLISTIDSWQSQGFEEYHGTAWYRKTFTVSSADYDAAQLEDKKLLLFVGAVDGDAVFYLNGQKIAERKQYSNSWMDAFALDVSSSLVVGRNTIAVQVTKDKLAAGLYKGVSLIAGVPKDKDK